MSKFRPHPSEYLSTPDEYAEFRSSMWRTTRVAAAAVIGVIAICVVAFVFSACSGASNPTRFSVRGAVLSVAHGVVIADEVCAETAEAIAKTDHDKGLKLATTCADAYSVARVSLISAGKIVDEMGTSEAPPGTLVCVLSKAVNALTSVARALEDVGAKLPSAVSDGVASAHWVSSFASAGACAR